MATYNLENLTRSNETLKMASDQCSTVYKLYDRLITEWIICSIGAILNLLCVIVYAHPKQLNSSENFKMRHYILIKSICNAFFLTISSFRGIIDCSSEPYCLASRSEAGQIFNWIVSQYLSYIAKLASMFLESMATIDCFIYISRRFKFYHKINYIVVIVVISLMSSSTTSTSWRQVGRTRPTRRGTCWKDASRVTWMLWYWCTAF